MLTDRDLIQMRPSGLSIVINCAGSRRLAMQAPPEKPSSYASEGTAAHSLGEQCLRTYRAPFEFRGQIIMADGVPFKVNDDMIKAVGHYVSHIWGKLHTFHPDRIHKLEQKVRIPQINNGGTVDSVILSVEDMRLDLDDYKHGAGVYVSEVLNAQMMCYALGVFYDLWPRGVPKSDDLRITTTIHQPRFEDVSPIRPYSFTFRELQEWNEYVLIPAIQRSRDPNAPLTPGSHCQFCKAKPICGAYLTSDRPRYKAVPIQASAVPSGFKF